VSATLRVGLATGDVCKMYPYLDPFGWIDWSVDALGRPSVSPRHRSSGKKALVGPYAVPKTGRGQWLFHGQPQARAPCGALDRFEKQRSATGEGDAFGLGAWLPLGGGGPTSCTVNPTDSVTVALLSSTCYIEAHVGSRDSCTQTECVCRGGRGCCG